MEQFNVNQELVTQAIDLGFPREQSTIALYIKKNDLQQAIELMLEKDCDL